MAFDYQAAKKAGATDDQILQYLNQTRGYDVQGAIKAGASKSQVIDYLSATEQGITPKVQKKSVMGKIEGAAQKISNFFGAKGITEQFGASIARARLPDDQKKYVEEPGLKKVLGSAIQSGANLIPGLGVGAKTLSKIGTGLATGYALDVGSNLQSSEDVGQALKPGAGALVGGALPLLGKVTGLANTAKFSKNIANKLEELNLRLTPVEKQNLAKQGKQISDYLASKKIVGTPANRYAKISRLYDDMEKVVTENIKKSTVEYSKKEILSELAKIPESFSNDPAGYADSLRGVNAIIKFIKDKSPEKIPGELLNNYKRNLFKRAYSKNNTDVVNETFHAIGSLFKERLDDTIPSLQKLNQEYGKLITAKKLLFKATSRSQAGLLGKTAGLVAGTSIGGSLAGPGGAAVGAFVGPQVTNAVATPIRSTTGAGFQKINEIVNKIPEDKRGRLLIGRKALINLLEQF